MRCNEGIGVLKGCGRSRTTLSVAGRLYFPAASPTAGPARWLAGGPLPQRSSAEILQERIDKEPAVPQRPHSQ